MPNQDGDGPEGKNVIGEIKEHEIEAFFSNFLKWDLIYNNFDERFFSVDSNKTERNGFDFLYQLYEPFIENSFEHGVFVECKSVKNGKVFNKDRFETDIENLRQKIKKAQTSPNIHNDTKIIDYGINYYRYGILCYRFSNFDLNKYQKVLSEYEMRNKNRGNNFPVIFVLSNERLSTFFHLRKRYSQIIYHYPIFSSHEKSEDVDKLSLFYLYSDFIPLEYVLKDPENGKPIGSKVKSILSFDKPSVESFQLLKQFCSKFGHNISSIILANANHEKKGIHQRYLEERGENKDRGEIKLIYLNRDMNCAEDLAEVFL